MSQFHGSAEQPANHLANSAAEQPAGTSNDPLSIATSCKETGAVHLLCRSLVENRSDESSAEQPATYTDAMDDNVLQISAAQPDNTLQIALVLEYLPQRELAQSSVAVACQNWLQTHRQHTNRVVALFVHAPTSIRLIVRYLGAHIPEAIWTCSECNPYWYNWYCTTCHWLNRPLNWTPTQHFGCCAKYSKLRRRRPEKCLCCRSAKETERMWHFKLQRAIPSIMPDFRIISGSEQVFPLCECCENLLKLKGCCHTTRELLKKYNGSARWKHSCAP